MSSENLRHSATTNVSTVDEMGSSSGLHERPEVKVKKVEFSNFGRHEQSKPGESSPEKAD